MTRHSPRLTQHELNLLDNSIERVINTTLTILKNIDPKLLSSENLRELISINLQDWQDLKTSTVQVWNEARNAVFISRNPPSPTPSP